MPQPSIGAATMARTQIASSMSVDRSQSAETNIGTIHVHTAATDAAGIAKDIRGQLRRYDYVTESDRGLG
jgi:hypothetical protein